MAERHDVDELIEDPAEARALIAAIEKPPDVLIIRDDLRGGVALEVLAHDHRPTSRESGKPIKKRVDPIPPQYRGMGLDQLRNVYEAGGFD